MTADDERGTGAAPSSSEAPRLTPTLPPPLEEVAYEPARPLQRWLLTGLLVVLIGGGLAALLYFVTGPHVPREAVRVLDEFIAAINAEDFDTQYALLAELEPLGPQAADVPLLPKEKLQRELDRAVKPPFFSGLRLGDDMDHYHVWARGEHRVWAVEIPIEDFGSAPPPVGGDHAGIFTVAIRINEPPYRVFAFATYGSFYLNNYSKETSDTFSRKLLEAYGSDAP